MAKETPTTDIGTLKPVPKAKPPRTKITISQAEINEVFRKHPRWPRNAKFVKRARAAVRKRKLKEQAKIGKQISGAQSDSDWQIIYGKMRVGGVYTFIHTINQNQQLLLVITLAGHEIQAIDKVFFDDEEVVFGSGFPGQCTAPAKWAGKVYAQINFGSDAQSALSQLITDAPDKWTSNHKQSGRAHIYLKLTWDANSFPGGLPDITFDVRGKKVYDPRTTLTAYSNNAALCVADYLMDTKYGMGVPLADIDTTLLSDSADNCDENVNLNAGGTEKRYALNGAFGATQSARNILEGMCSAMGGFIVYSGGKWRIYSAKYRTPTVTLSESDIFSELSVQTKLSRRDSFNGVKGTYSSPENNYESTDFPAVRNSFYKSQDSDEEILEDIQLPFTTSGATAQRLAKIELERIRQQITIDALFSLKAFQVEPGEVVSLSYARFGWVAKPFEVVESQLSIENDIEGMPAYGVRLNLRETASGVYDWNNGEETRVDLAPNTTLPNPFTVTTPTGLTLTSGTSELYIRADGTVFSRIKVAWTPMADFFVSSGGTIEIEYKKSADVNWSTATPVAGSASFSHILDVQDGVLYDVRIRARSALGVYSSYATVSNHLVVGKTAAPSDVTGFQASVESFGIRFNWDAVPDLDVLSYIIKTGDQNQSWSDSQYIAEVSTTDFFFEFQSSGTYKFQIKSKDTSNNESTNATTVTVTIGAPSQPAVSYILLGENLFLGWTQSTGLFAIDYYDLRLGLDFNTAFPVAQVKSTNFNQKVTWGGLQRFWVAGRDVAGNTGPAGSVDVEILVPTVVQNLTVDVVDNNVLLRWTAPPVHTLPIDYYKVYKGATFAGATLIGQVAATFDAVFEVVGGTYIYWIVPYDTAGNAGTELGIQAIVNQPPDYVLVDDQILDLDSGSYVNAIIDHDVSGNDFLLAPVNATETWQDHFVNNGWTTPAAQFLAGYPLYIQPTPAGAYWQKTIDYGVIIPGSIVKLNYVLEQISGALGVVTKMAYSADNVIFQEQSGVTQIYASNFRYVRIRFEIGTIAANTGEAMGLLLALTNP